MELSQVKKGGPYPKGEKRKRLEEVHRLHFDYGYSARKIAEFLKVNRGTINRDIMSLYADVSKRWRHYSLELLVMRQIDKFEIQLTRLRKQLDTAETVKEQISIEKFIFDINVKIANFKMRLAEANNNVIFLATDVINDKLNNQKKNNRVVPKSIFYDVSEKAREKMYNIYHEDMQF